MGLFMLNMNGNNSKENRFWDWFVENQDTYYNKIEDLEVREKIFDDLSSELHKIHEDLVFEFSPIHENSIREFTISADGLKELFSYVENLVNAAPKLKNWQINAFRQPVPGDDLQLQMGEWKVSYSDIFFRYVDDQDKIGIELNIRDFDGTGSSQNAVFILLDGLIGEYNIVKKISWIDWVKLDESKADPLMPLIELRDIIKN
jgi:hypothetical protein